MNHNLSPPVLMTLEPKGRRKPQVNGLGFLHQLLRKNWTRKRDENGIEWGPNFRILNKENEQFLNA